MLSEPGRVLQSPAAQSGQRVLESRVHRVAATGRLRVSEARAVGLVQAAGVGVIQVLLATPPEQRDPGLAEAMYEAVLAQILTDAPGARRRRADGGGGRVPGARPRLEALSDRRAATCWSSGSTGSPPPVAA